MESNLSIFNCGSLLRNILHPFLSWRNIERLQDFLDFFSILKLLVHSIQIVLNTFIVLLTLLFIVFPESMFYETSSQALNREVEMCDPNFFWFPASMKESVSS